MKCSLYLIISNIYGCLILTLLKIWIIVLKPYIRFQCDIYFKKREKTNTVTKKKKRSKHTYKQQCDVE